MAINTERFQAKTEDEARSEAHRRGWDHMVYAPRTGWCVHASAEEAEMLVEAGAKYSVGDQ